MDPKGLYAKPNTIKRYSPIILEIRGSHTYKKMMRVNARHEKEDSVIKVPYPALTLKEALYLLTKYYDGYFDAGKQSVILTE